jgi:hypothetical protein
MSITTKITESMLDHVYRLEQARKNEIENTGDSVTIWPGRGQLKTIKENNTFYFSQSATIKPGYILTHVDCFGAFLVTTITDQAGRLAAETMQLKSKASFYTAVPVSTDALGRPHYSLRPQNWSAIPCTPIEKNKVTFPAQYCPDLGDVLLIDHEHYKVIGIVKDGVTVTATLEVF